VWWGSIRRNSSHRSCPIGHICHLVITHRPPSLPGFTALARHIIRLTWPTDISAELLANVVGFDPEKQYTPEELTQFAEDAIKYNKVRRG
jgi:hypothetical protein